MDKIRHLIAKGSWSCAGKGYCKALARTTLAVYKETVTRWCVCVRLCVCECMYECACWAGMERDVCLLIHVGSRQVIYTLCRCHSCPCRLSLSSYVCAYKNVCVCTCVSVSVSMSGMCMQREGEKLSCTGQLLQRWQCELLFCLFNQSASPQLGLPDKTKVSQH